MEIKKIDGDFSVCKVKDYTLTKLHAEYCFTGTTDEEKSLVCLTKDIPANTLEREDGWRAFRIQGVLDFSLIGILSKISALLAEQQIGIFVISTFILTKTESYDKALKVLEHAGYKIIV